ncbi:MAG: DUF188 domain-containing protein [Lachnospira sp.]|nr:DUF188 domain-containing protein [Lachnospira sp.]
MDKSKEFKSNVIKELGYYVYIYSDPDSKKPFYIGKGQGNRCFAHLYEESDKEKVMKIKEIHDRGKEPLIEILVYAGADAVDFALISLVKKNDLVVTQDYGVAAMTLGKGASAIHQSGKWYTNENIDQMLMERHLSKKARRASSKNHMKGHKKRTDEDDARFEVSFEKMLLNILGR